MIEKQHPETLLQYGQPLPSYRRLVILIPNADIDEIRLAQRIRIMMSPKKIDIFLLSSVTREEDVSLEHRRLTNLEAILRDPFYKVTSKILSGKHWIAEIKENLLPSDLLVFLDGEYPPIKHSRKQTVSQALASQLPCPVMILNNITIKIVPQQSKIHQIVGWLVSLVIILLFIGFDNLILQNARGWISTLMLSMVMLVEVGLIWGWNNLWD